MRNLRLFLISLLISTAICATGLANASNQITRMWNGNILLEASDSHLNEIIKELYDKYSVEVSGLENREDDRVTFKLEAETLETLLRGLLRNLGVKNFAIEYLDATLKRIVVVPDQISATDASDSATTNRSNHSDTLNVVQIRGIVEFSQAEFLDLAEGDYIVEYDGVPITSAKQLVKEVEKKSANTQVEMIVIREKSPMRMILAGGMIGVKVVTKTISKEMIGMMNDEL
jgi:membrane-associated protease RseP (regulator of RpoE activity)